MQPIVCILPTLLAAAAASASPAATAANIAPAATADILTEQLNLALKQQLLSSATQRYYQTQARNSLLVPAAAHAHAQPLTYSANVDPLRPSEAAQGCVTELTNVAVNRCTPSFKIVCEDGEFDVRRGGSAGFFAYGGYCAV